MFDNTKPDRQRSDDSVEREPRSARLQSGTAAAPRMDVDGQSAGNMASGAFYNRGEDKGYISK
jgi:hypothetical protein